MFKSEFIKCAFLIMAIIMLLSYKIQAANNPNGIVPFWSMVGKLSKSTTPNSTAQFNPTIKGDLWVTNDGAGHGGTITADNITGVDTLTLNFLNAALGISTNAVTSDHIIADSIIANYLTSILGISTNALTADHTLIGYETIMHGLNVDEVTTNSINVGLLNSTTISNSGDATISGSVLSEFNDTNGFSVTDRANTIITCDGTSRVFSISPASGTTFSYFDGGQKYTKTGAQSITLDDTYGMHIVYYTGATLSKQVNPTATQLKSYILDDCIVAMIIYNSGHILLLGDERHGISMSPASHLHEHLYEQVQYKSGIALTDIVADNTGASNTHAQLGNDAGVIADEDIDHSINAIASTTGYTIWARTGATGTWEERIQAGYPILVTGTGRPAYNTLSGGIYHIYEVTNNSFVLAHVCATNDVSGDPIVIMGQNQYTSLTLAREGANTEVNTLSLGVLPDPEIKFIGTVIFECRDAYTNDVNARIRTTDGSSTYVDWRTAKASGGTSPTNHDLLSNLRGSAPYNHLSDTDYARVLVGTSEIFVTGTQEIQVSGNRFDFKNLGVSRSGDTIEVWAPQSGGGGSFDPTNDYITLNNYLMLKEVSRDTITAPDTAEIKIFLDSLTHEPCYKNWLGNVYKFTTERSQYGVLVDCTQSSSTDFTQAVWVETDAQSRITKTSATTLTYTAGASVDSQCGVVYTMSEKANIDMTFNVNFASDFPNSNMFLGVSSTNNMATNGDFPVDFYLISGGTVRCRTANGGAYGDIATSQTSGTKYFRIQVFNYNGLSASVNMWYGTSVSDITGTPDYTATGITQFNTTTWYIKLIFDNRITNSNVTINNLKVIRE